MTGSPAHSAGMKEGDVVTQFGTVHAGNDRQLRALVEVVRQNVGRPVEVVVLRQEEAGGHVDDALPSAFHRLTLIPQPWGGQGMLGCAARCARSVRLQRG